MDTLRVFIRWCESIGAVSQNLSETVIPQPQQEENTRDVMMDAENPEAVLGHLRTDEYTSEQHVVFGLMWRA